MKFNTIIVAVFLFGSCSQHESTSHLHASLSDLRVKVDSLSKAIELKEKEPEKNYWFSNDYDGNELLEKGILRPQQFIDSSLEARIELIPIKAVLGGTMSFGRIEIISKNWLIAEFTDGHLWGVALYSFKLNLKKELNFTLISHQLY